MVTTADGIDRFIEVQEFKGYIPFPKQLQFHQSEVKYPLFGGAAGPGKTMALLMDSIRAANFPGNAGVNTLLLRRSYKELERGMMLTFEREIPKEFYKSFNKSEHRVTYHNGSITQFGYMESERDYEQYQGTEWLKIGLDETTQFTLNQWMMLQPWNRSPGRFAQMQGATNPIGAGTRWVRDLWIHKRPAAGMDPNQIAKYNPAHYDYIKATLEDNPIYARDQEYRDRLDSLPKGLRDALLYASWDVIAGVYFDIFNEATMTEPAAQMGIKPWWPKWISIDWGFEHPSAVYWHTQDESNKTHTYRELVVRHTDPPDLAAAICQAIKDGEEFEGEEEIDAIYLSPDAFAKRDSRWTFEEQMRAVFRENKFPAPIRADDDRKGGWMLMYNLLKRGYWTIASECQELIQTLPILIRDEKDPEDILKMSGDDSADSARYGIKSRLGAAKVPVEEVVRKKVAHIEDPTSRHLMAVKIEHEERKKRQPFVIGGRRRGLTRR